MTASATTSASQKLADALHANPGRTAKELALLAGIGGSTATKMLANMEATHVAVRTVPVKGAATWAANPSMVRTASDRDAYAAAAAEVAAQADADAHTPADATVEAPAPSDEDPAPLGDGPDSDTRRHEGEALLGSDDYLADAQAQDDAKVREDAEWLAARHAEAQPADPAAGDVTKLTGLTGLNVRALTETVGVLESAATTATVAGTPGEVLARIDAARSGMADRRSHPYASLNAVVRKLGGLAGPAAKAAAPAEGETVDRRRNADRSHYVPRGGLKAMVWAHMAGTVGTEWTPGKLATAMAAKSAGAVQDGCEAAVKAGLAVRCEGSPRRYTWVQGAAVPAEQAALAAQVQAAQA